MILKNLRSDVVFILIFLLPKYYYILRLLFQSSSYFHSFYYITTSELKKNWNEKSFLLEVVEEFIAYKFLHEMRLFTRDLLKGKRERKQFVMFVLHP